ncbi:MAG: hypothetical protein ACTHOK_19585 [Nocardioidaceae bacterium]
MPLSAVDFVDRIGAHVQQSIEHQPAFWLPPEVTVVGAWTQRTGSDLMSAILVRDKRLSRPQFGVQYRRTIPPEPTDEVADDFAASVLDWFKEVLTMSGDRRLRLAVEMAGHDVLWLRPRRSHDRGQEWLDPQPPPEQDASSRE